MNPTPAPLWRTNRPLLTLLILLSLTLSLSKGFAQQIVVNGSNYIGSNVSISTSANNAAGVGINVINSGSALITGGTVKTTGAGASAVALSGSSSFTGNNLTLTTNATGAGAFGLSVDNSHAVLNGGTISIVGVGSSGHPVYALNKGVVEANNVYVETKNTNTSYGYLALTGGTITINGGTVSTSGGVGSGNTYGVSVSGTGSVIRANDLQVITSGSRGLAAVSGPGGYLELNRVNMNATNIKEAALIAYSGGTISGDHVNIISTGQGVLAQDASSVTLNNSQIATSGSSANFGVANDSYGVYITSTSRFTGTNLMVNTTGNGAHGVAITNSSTAVITNGTITSSGKAAHGVNVTTGGRFTGSNLVISTSGSDSGGLRVDGTNSVATLSDSQITTTGSFASGVLVTNIAGATAYANHLNVTTEGFRGQAIYMTAYSQGIQTLVVTGGTYKSLQGDGININAYKNYPGFSEAQLLAGVGASFDLTIQDGALITGTAAMEIGSIKTANYDTGADVDVLTQATVAIKNGSQLIGDANFFDSAVSNITFSGSSSLTGDVLASGSSLTNISFNQSSTLSGKSALTDTAVLNVTVDNSAWNMTDSSVLTNLTMNNGKVTFKHDSDTSFKTLLVKGDLTGGNGDQIDMTTNLGIRKGDLLVVRGADGGSYTLSITNVDGAPAGPNEVLRVVSTRDGGAAFTLTGNQYRDAGMYRYHFLKDNNQWYLVNGNGSGNQGGGGADDTTKGGYGGDTPTNNGSGDDGQGGNGSNQGTVPGGTNGEGYTKFSGSVNNDPYVPSGTTTPPTPPTPSGNDLSDLAHDILNATGAQVIAQFNGLDNMAAHFNALRGGVNGSGMNGWMIDEAKRDINIWVQSYGSQYNISGNYGGRNFSNMVYGVDVGADKAYQIDKNNLLVVGVFAGYGQTDADFHHQGSDANSESYGGGVYATWLEQSGWYADLTLRGAYIDGSFDSYNEQYQKSSGSYNNMAASAALNFGKRCTFQDNWYAEPSVGAAYVYLTGYDYQTGGASNVDVNVTDANVFRFKFGSAFGRTINFNGKSWLQPYVKVFGIEQCSDGGKVQSSGSEWRPAMDGLAAQLGCGVVWQLNEDNQLHLDYDAEFGQHYDKPFGITAGFRHQF